MMVCRGEIWLVNLNPSKKPNEMSKVRPVVVFQNNELNHSDYPTTIIINNCVMKLFNSLSLL